MLMAGCEGIQNEIVPQPPSVDQLACMQVETSAYAPLTGTDAHAGFSVAMATWGQGSLNQNAFRSLVAGAPGDGTTTGFVRLAGANPGTGLLDPGGPRNQTLAPPAGAPTERYFGYAVHAADIHSCIGSPANFCGEELLVGAPDLAGIEKGLALWYKPTAAGSGSYTLGGTITPRVGLAAAAQFGASFASSAHLNVSNPWIVAPDVPEWVAIGAPGADKVEIYAVNPTSATPLTYVTHLSGPLAGRRFGHAMVAGDFNGDGYADLAVGAPDPVGATPEGRVYVYRGWTPADGGPARPVLTTPIELNAFVLSGMTSTGGVQDDGFGFSLAAGPFANGQFADRDGLVVGAPFNDYNGGYALEEQQGGVCTFIFKDNPAAPSKLDVTRKCSSNPWYASRDTTDAFFGYSVAVGNYMNLDDHMIMDSAAARQQEVAVGSPGVNGDKGEVNVFLTGDTGLRILDLSALLLEFPGETTGSRFGASLADGYVQQSGWEDLVVGAPDHPVTGNSEGTATLTQAIDSSACAEVTGVWEIQDADSVTKKVTILTDSSGDMHLTFLSDTAAEIRDDGGTGDLCTATPPLADPETLSFDIPRSTDLFLDDAWDCDASDTQTWLDVSADAVIDGVLQSLGVNTSDPVVATYLTALGPQVMDVTLTFNDSVTPALLTIEVDTDKVDWATLNSDFGVDTTCRLAGQPWVAELVQSGVCED